MGLNVIPDVEPTVEPDMEAGVKPAEEPSVEPSVESDMNPDVEPAEDMETGEAAENNCIAPRKSRALASFSGSSSSSEEISITRGPAVRVLLRRLSETFVV